MSLPYHAAPIFEVSGGCVLDLKPRVKVESDAADDEESRLFREEFSKQERRTTKQKVIAPLEAVAGPLSVEAIESKDGK